LSLAVQKRLDKNPQAMRQRRETVEHPFGTLKMRMGATHFLMKRRPKADMGDQRFLQRKLTPEPHFAERKSLL
jgi:hypothetical protein